jgi:hypothetical protein
MVQRSMDKNASWFEETWKYRDEVLYPTQFGVKSSDSIVPIPYEAFAQIGAEQVDPRWLQCGVLTFPPTPTRAAFTYVTSRLSNAWDDDRPNAKSVSSLGIELRLDNTSEEGWPIDVLLRLSAMQLLIGAGRFATARVLDEEDRVRVSPETFGKTSSMVALLATNVAGFQLLSGSFRLIQLFAISDAEHEFAAKRGGKEFLKILREKTSYPTNDIARRSAV